MRKHLAVSLVAAALVGCGGGIYLSFGPTDNPPSVSLAAGADSAAAGQTVHLVAAASDDDFVSEVAFYRVDGSGAAVYLGALRSPPYAFDTLMPAVPRGNAVQFFATATDSAGQSTDSSAVVVTAL